MHHLKKMFGRGSSTEKKDEEEKEPSTPPAAAPERRDSDEERRKEKKRAPRLPPRSHHRDYDRDEFFMQEMYMREMARHRARDMDRDFDRDFMQGRYMRDAGRQGTTDEMRRRYEEEDRLRREHQVEQQKKRDEQARVEKEKEEKRVKNQMERASRKQERNRLGGFSFVVDDLMKFRRVLVLGVYTGTYNASDPISRGMEHNVVLQNLLAEGKGMQVLEIITTFSIEGRTPKQDSLLYSLAVLARQDKDQELKKEVYKRLPAICRIPTFLFQFIGYSVKLSKGKGWGRASRTGVSKWYLSFRNNPMKLAQHITKYQSREGWSHRDLLRLVHVALEEDSPALEFIFTYIVKGMAEAKLRHPKVWQEEGGVPPVVEAMEEDKPEDGEEKKEEDDKKDEKDGDGAHNADKKEGDKPEEDKPDEAPKEEENKVKEKKAKKGKPKKERKPRKPKKPMPERTPEQIEKDNKDAKKVYEFLTTVESMKNERNEETVVAAIRNHGLVREHVPTQLLKSVPVWAALCERMPLTALIRNLGRMTSMGLLEHKTDANADYAEVIEGVCNKLTDDAQLKGARIHPFNVLLAMVQYKIGHGDKGGLTWSANKKIVDALEEGFYKSFKHVEATGKRWCLALDVSGSMCTPVLGATNITCRDASAAMAMVTARTEPNHEIVGFSHRITPLAINKDMKLDQVINVISRTSMGGTDCAAPMIWAQKEDKEFDVFVVYTDSETWFGKIHPHAALKQYRDEMDVPDARLIVVGMSSNRFTIADPDDPGMMDIVGFDSAAPEIMRNFAVGQL